MKKVVTSVSTNNHIWDISFCFPCRPLRAVNGKCPCEEEHKWTWEILDIMMAIQIEKNGKEKWNWKWTEVLNILMARPSPHRLYSITLTDLFLPLFVATEKETAPTSRMSFLSLDELRMWKSALLLIVFVSLGKFVKHDEIPPSSGRRFICCFCKRRRKTLSPVAALPLLCC